MQSPVEQRLLRRQKVLADFGDFALRSEDLDEVLDMACRLVADAVGTRRAKVLEVQDGGATLFVRAGTGWPEGVVGRVRIAMNAHSSESFSIRAKEPVISRDILDETRFDVPEFMVEAGIRALANVPIFLPGGHLYGLLQVDATEPRQFDIHDTGFLRTYASILGPVIDRLFKIRDLRQTERRFSLIVEEVRDYAIFITDEQDRIVDWLPGAAEIFGWTAEEAVGHIAATLLSPEDRKARTDRPEAEEARLDAFVPVRRWWQRKNGSRVFFEGSIRALDMGSQRRCFVNMGQDMTRRRQADARHRFEDAQRTFLLSLSDAIRSLSNPEEVRRVAVRLLGRHLKASRVAFAENVGDGEHYEVFENYVDGVEEITGRYRYDAFGVDILEHLQSGRLRIQPDIANDARLGAAEKRGLSEAGVAASLNVPLVRDGQLVAWLGINYAAPHDFTLDELDLAEDVSQRTWFAIEQARAEAALRASEERLEIIFASAPVGLSEIAVDGRFLRANAELCRILDRTHAQLMEMTVQQVTHPDDIATSIEAIGRVIATDEPAAVDKRYLRPDGTVMWASSTIALLKGRSGRPDRLLAVTADLTTRREAEELHKVLIAELQHRTRNLMAVVLALSRSTARSSTDLAGFIASFQDRLEALARVQRLLSRLSDLGRISFDALIESELAAVDADARRVTLEGPKGIRLRSSTVQILAMALHELATNAVKYGALGQEAGHLAVAWDLRAVEGQGAPWLHVDWRESGVEMPDRRAAPHGGGQGRKLIETALPYQLNARTSYGFEPDGVHCTILIPVSQTAE
ncbi:PAS domain S-box protein [Cereibacter sp. SYSU M97828]|nr:PAS domain S-box protein [Cereibacter flavus]